MDKYYLLLDKETTRISLAWKVVHISTLVVAIISGFITAYTFGKSVEAFGDNCFLFAEVHFLKNRTPIHHVLMFGVHHVPSYIPPIDNSATNWSSMDHCYFCQFTPLTAMIFAIIWCAFFIMCAKGGAGYLAHSLYRPWRIVYPALIFAAVATSVMLYSTLSLQKGVEQFCAQFYSVFNTTKCTSSLNDYTLGYSDIQKNFLVMVRLTIICSYVCLFGWMLHLISLILRVVCIVDFQMIQITVTDKDEEETLQSVIDPETQSTDTVSLASMSESTDGKVGIKKFFRLHKPKAKPLPEPKTEQRRVTFPDEYQIQNGTSAESVLSRAAQRLKEEQDKDSAQQKGITFSPTRARGQTPPLAEAEPMDEYKSQDVTTQTSLSCVRDVKMLR